MWEKALHWSIAQKQNHVHKRRQVLPLFSTKALLALTEQFST